MSFFWNVPRELEHRAILQLTDLEAQQGTLEGLAAKDVLALDTAWNPEPYPKPTFSK
jgi:hypothetical protein